jgi:alpha-glucosidase
VAWWRDAVIYQVYVRSFADSNGDGVGDLRGIIAKLPYLVQLGVDAIWLNPFYPSPQKDAGYDVSDYRDVEPLFGDLRDFDDLIGAAHGSGLRVIVDLVPNHTSSEHPWFRAAVAAAPGSRERARYLFRDGRGESGEFPPNDWQSIFGGSAWTRVADGQWYLHLFAPEQPDLDWTDPDVVAEFDEILRFWLDRGVDGFRIDVAHGLAKDPDLVDMPADLDPLIPSWVAQARHPFWDRDEVHEVYRRWRRTLESYPGDRVTVAEAWVYDPIRYARYVRRDELHTAFNFTFLMAPWDAPELQGAIDDTLESLRDVGAPATWVLANHDVEREVSRYGEGAIGLRRARAASLLMLSLPGSAYIYQGEELGLEEVHDIPPELRQDPLYYRSGGANPGRDGCRVPMPWSGDAPPFGFSSNPGAWLPQPPAWAVKTAQAQERDPASMLTLYRNALRIRRSREDMRAGELHWLETDASVLAFTRGTGFACVVNAGSEPVPLPGELASARVLLASDALERAGYLPGDTAVWVDLPS